MEPEDDGGVVVVVVPAAVVVIFVAAAAAVFLYSTIMDIEPSHDPSSYKRDTNLRIPTHPTCSCGHQMIFAGQQTQKAEWVTEAPYRS